MKTILPLIYDGTVSTPKITFQPFKGFFEISGESRPENAWEFYKEVQVWLKRYCSIFFSEKDLVRKQLGMTLIFKMDYFNSISAKFFLDILTLLEEYYTKGFKIEVEWHYGREDIDMLESGIGFSEFVKLPFMLIEKTDNLLVESTKKTPAITIIPEDNVYDISGMSYPEEGVFFYQSVMDWIDEYGEKHFTAETVFDFKLTYCNTSSSKAILMIFKKLDLFYLKGLYKQINWVYENDIDDEEIELIQDYKEFVSIPIKLIEIDKVEG